jgi:formylglycine-generating enzyme required for sulfatase activity
MHCVAVISIYSAQLPEEVYFANHGYYNDFGSIARGCPFIKVARGHGPPVIRKDEHKPARTTMNRANDKLPPSRRYRYLLGVLTIALLFGLLFYCWGLPREQIALDEPMINTEEIRVAMTHGEKQIEFRINKAIFALIRIPQGEFYLGSPTDEEGHQATESPMRHIRISKPFYLGRYETTRLQYREVMGKDLTVRQGDLLPVDSVTYGEALEFCRQLSQRVGLPITLPTEAQWEYACRAGTTTPYYCGNGEDDLAKVAWYRGNSSETSHPVGQKQPNAWGLYDMHGNVWEPCIDTLPNYANISDADPTGNKSTCQGIIRGGGWMHPSKACRAATRMPANEMFGGMGIRIAINVDD